MNALVGVAAAGLTARVVDSYVRVTAERFEMRPSVLVEMIQHAADIADAASARRASIGETSHDATIRHEWARFAESARMTFDAPRRVISGTHRGDEMLLAMRSSPARTWVKAKVVLPLATGIDLALGLETTLTRFGKLIGFGDIEIGDPAFDKEFRITGRPLDAVKRLLSAEAPRASMAQLARTFTDVRLHDRFLDLVAPPLANAADLASLADQLSGFVTAVTGRAPAAGPYR